MEIHSHGDSLSWRFTLMEIHSHGCRWMIHCKLGQPLLPLSLMLTIALLLLQVPWPKGTPITHTDVES